MYSAIPPHKGVGDLCFFLLLGLSVNPIFSDNFIRSGIMANDTINATTIAIM